MFYTIIIASEDQVDKLYNKHLKSVLGISKIIYKSFSYDGEDDIGFVSLTTLTGKKVNYQLRGEKPYFVEFTGFGNIRYDVNYPEKHKNLYLLLKKYGIRAKKNFWSGGEI